MAGENGLYLLSMKETKFKHTEIGLIPEDWEIKTIGEIARIMSGGTPSTDVASYWNGAIQWFTPAELSKASKYVAKSERTITELGLKNSSAKLLPPGTILLTTRASIGATAILLNEACTNQGFQSLIVHKKFSNEFIFYSLPLVKNEMIKQASGSTFPEISAKKIASIGIALPPKYAEQERIAKALSNIDSLINNLDRTIEKKKDIRQGAMEQLLSDKKRLPGFKGEWKKIEIGEICKRMTRGDVLSASNMNKGIIPVIAAGVEPAGYCDKYNRNPMTISISGSGANAGFIAFHKNRIFATDCFTISASDNYDVEFIYYVLKMRQKEIYKLQTGGAQPHVYPRDLSFLSVYYTEDIMEQRAIADILTAMDDEIAVLQMERDKYANIRSGMMDDLLTGRKRL